MMEALQNLKRTNALCYNMCIICQENKPQPLHAATEQNSAIISEAAELRKKLRIMKFIETIDRLTAVLQTQLIQQLSGTMLAMLPTLVGKK